MYFSGFFHLFPAQIVADIGGMQALSELTCRGTPQNHACRSKNVRVNTGMSELTPVTVSWYYYIFPRAAGESIVSSELLVGSGGSGVGGA